MKLSVNENKILNIIKFSPILFVVFISLFSSQLYLIERESDFEKEIKVTKEKYLFQNKEKIKSEIERISNFINFEKRKAMNLLKKQMEERVYQAYRIAYNIYIKEKNTSDKEKVLLLIKNVLNSMSYDDKQEYIILKDSNKNNFLEIKEKLEKFDTNSEKISFYKYFEPFDLIIGTEKNIKNYEKELQQDILLSVKSIKDDKSTYIFIFDEKGNVLSHHKDSLIGTNRYNIKNPLGKYVVKDIIEFTILNKQGYMNYSTGVNPKNLLHREKTSYIKLIDDWNWIIGTGFYHEIFNKEIEKKTNDLLLSEEKSINRIIVFFIIITLSLILISFYISRVIAEMFLDYKKRIEKEIENTIKKEKLLIQQSKMAAMGEMIGNIAHQWRQPLSTISTASTGAKIQKEMNCLSDESLNNSLTAINDSAQYLSRTIDDFRDFFNPSNNKKEEFNISEAITKALNLVNSQFASKDIEIIQNIEEYKLISVENKLIQVLINILNNARDALITTENQRRLIFINTYKKDDISYIEILDNAGGIGANTIDRIFEPYFTTKHKSLGTGIGLYMSKEIIDKHLNAILLASDEKYSYEGFEYTGARFKIDFNAESKAI
ncbi:sensor histidine kinase [Poseidonibacter ostreae]|jgi:two-component system, NtrC family, sensor kinase|uniref:histidine kinase n=1 Tax=Poseidonibacter ostreae TaxID=2654171 RepID=A0A6L4WRX9_9BACT|nr:cache domain-containing protein [Poseidonibacter ostreae]KAB7886147.1 GHKL domain-containing protein [Poseidonibacter ostreae]KAB7887804.1 GHKL domain-containing protein [Poseidonibacter ostreae]KAB7888563.1 GHKL domain-containing protein [Poseidonibacter ostreae]